MMGVALMVCLKIPISGQIPQKTAIFRSSFESDSKGVFFRKNQGCF
jgi:hypothetical protein